MQKIKIRDLGPIDNVELEIKNINLLIGEQATGKSTIAKSIYFFRVIKTYIIDYLCQLSDGTSFETHGKKKDTDCVYVLKNKFKNIFVRLFGNSWNLKEDMFLSYSFDYEIYIDVKLKPGEKKYLSVRFSEQLNKEIKKLEKQVVEISKNTNTTITSIAFANSERMRNHENIKNNVNKIFNDDLETYYIPAGRSLLTTMANSKSLVMTATKNMDFVTEQFLLIIDNIRNDFREGILFAQKFYPEGNRRNAVESFAKKIIQILRGEYRYERGEEFLEIDDKSYNNGRVEINFASSGQQEVLWLVNYLYILLLRNERAFVIIEEPEAHIYPSLQKEIIELIVMFANLNESKVLITTHSPYVLNAVNNLYYAGVLCSENREQQVKKIVNKNTIIAKETLSAHKLRTAGEAEAQCIDLFENDKREICPFMIDEISNEFNRIYTELYKQ